MITLAEINSNTRTEVEVLQDILNQGAGATQSSALYVDIITPATLARACLAEKTSLRSISTMRFAIQQPRALEYALFFLVLPKYFEPRR